VRLDASHLFEPSTTHIGFRRGMFLRGYMYDFISIFAPHLNQKLVDEVAAIADHEARARRTRQLIESLHHI
jgi:LysR family cys regulon transcriptional activator